MRRVILAAVLIGLTLVSPQTSFGTGEIIFNDGQAQGGGAARNESLEAYVNLWAGGGPARPRGLSCTSWLPATSADAQVHAWDLWDTSDLPFRKRLYDRTCGNDPAKQVQSTWVVVDPVVPVAAAVVATARRLSLPKPTARFAPAADRMIVTVGTWFWMDAQQATTRRDVSVAFPNFRLTVSAVPTALVFEPGDGDEAPKRCDSPYGCAKPVRCEAPGWVWTPADGDDKPSPCMYTYRHSSAITGDDLFHATLSVEWSTSWRTSNGNSGVLDPQTTTSAIYVTVKEIQAVVTG